MFSSISTGVPSVRASATRTGFLTGSMYVPDFVGNTDVCQMVAPTVTRDAHRAEALAPPLGQVRDLVADVLRDRDEVPTALTRVLPQRRRELIAGHSSTAAPRRARIAVAASSSTARISASLAWRSSSMDIAAPTASTAAGARSRSAAVGSG